MGISADAEIEDIKAAYRRLSKQYHPDTTSLPIEIAAQKFIQLKVELLNLRRNNVCCHSESRNS
jgi:DnaJ-class molecular chaperone